MSANSLVDEIGGEEIVRALVERFYDLIETHPRGRSILELHMDGHGVAHSRIEQFNFLCGFMGGRKYYLEKHHHLNLKQMHEHISITQSHADDWLFCMNLALDEVAIAVSSKTRLMEAFERVAISLVKLNKV